jgi:hypothetical protein
MSYNDNWGNWQGGDYWPTVGGTWTTPPDVQIIPDLPSKIKVTTPDLPTSYAKESALRGLIVIKNVPGSKVDKFKEDNARLFDRLVWSGYEYLVLPGEGDPSVHFINLLDR